MLSKFILIYLSSPGNSHVLYLQRAAYLSKGPVFLSLVCRRFTYHSTAPVCSQRVCVWQSSVSLFQQLLSGWRYLYRGNSQVTCVSSSATRICRYEFFKFYEWAVGKGRFIESAPSRLRNIHTIGREKVLRGCCILLWIPYGCQDCSRASILHV